MLSQHNPWPALRVCVVGFVLALTGCAGNGAGLDSNGIPVGSSPSDGGGNGGGSGGTTADFDSIQKTVFTPICSPCHSGAGAPLGLQLDAAHSYNLLVGVPSGEVPNLNRVKAGDPDSSYIIIKLTNGPGIVGEQMPRGEPPLPAATIAAIKQWITNGAPPAGTSSATPAEAVKKLQSVVAQNAAPPPFSVSFTSPEDGSFVDQPLNQILVVFNHEVDASLVNYTTLTVERVDMATSAIPSFASLAEGNPSTVIIKPVKPLLPGTYKVTARGSGGGAIADLNAQALVGDYSFTFTVDGSP
jgi:methionine-rich copper-binding protein CopC